MTRTFHDLGVHPDLVAALEAEGITEPFPIQDLTIPVALSGADVIGQARTGTGKTLAFGLPLLQRLDGPGGVRALVVTPTRELCLQVSEDLARTGEKVGASVLAVYGGTALKPQRDAFRDGEVDVVVGTPGRLLDHLGRGDLDLSGVAVLVLDEADRMLDMGFLPDVERLIAACRDDRQTLLFSATMPGEVVALARRYMAQPTFLSTQDDEGRIAPGTEQHFFLVHRLDKPRVLARLLQSPGVGLAAVFVSTKRMADRLVDELRELGVTATPIHGDLRQERRERNLDRFRTGKAGVLVATEVAARGLDIEGVTHVINYDCPEDERAYLHRIGRTGRAGAAGVAITFASHSEVERVNVIRKRVAPDRPLDDVFSTSEVLRERFDLPEKAPWDRWGEQGDGAEPRPQPRAAEPRPQPRAAEPRPTPSEGPDATVLVGEQSPERTRVRRRTTAQPTPAPAEKDTKRTRQAPTRRREPAADATGPDTPRTDRRRSERRRTRPAEAKAGAPEPRPAAAEPPALTRPGDDARGPGRPMLHRQLRIEHIP